ncbi:hypothetical protein B7463_g95, partial [Scytalidium lignicola]
MSFSQKVSLHHLVTEHLSVVTRAISNVLSTDVAEFTYAQIVAGLPTRDSYGDFHYTTDVDEGSPVLHHLSLCDRVLAKTRTFKSNFDPLSLQFDAYVLQAFQNERLGSRAFLLRLVELVAVACHQIAVFLYKLDHNLHKGQYEKWRIAREEVLRASWTRSVPLRLPPVPFFHRSYNADKQYPNGTADIAGYWAEAKILGGVVLFDRGKSDLECNRVFFHQSLRDGPRTIYPLTDIQFKDLTNFLLSERDVAAPECPLPIHGSKFNRPRYDPYFAMKYFHIFRDRFERTLPAEHRRPHKFSDRDYPEIEDQLWILNHQFKAGEKGEPVDEAEMAIRQAVQVTYDLGFRWLWIDALSGADNADAGLSIMRDPRKVKPCLLNLQGTHWPTAKIQACISIDFASKPFHPISNRGWVFQEEILATRRLYFGSRELFWRCFCDSSSESDPRYTNEVGDTKELDDLLGTDRRVAQLKEGFDYFRISLQYKDPWPKRKGLRDNHFDHWYALIADYNERELTYPSDVLPALSGIASAMAQLHGCTYMAGLWLEDLQVGLSWLREGRRRLEDDRLTLLNEKIDDNTDLDLMSFQFVTKKALTLEGLLRTAAIDFSHGARSGYSNILEGARWCYPIKDIVSGKGIGFIALDNNPDQVPVQLVHCLLCDHYCWKVTCLALALTNPATAEFRRLDEADYNLSGRFTRLLKSLNTDKFARQGAIEQDQAVIANPVDRGSVQRMFVPKTGLMSRSVLEKWIIMPWRWRLRDHLAGLEDGMVRMRVVLGDQQTKPCRKLPITFPTGRIEPTEAEEITIIPDPDADSINPINMIEPLPINVVQPPTSRKSKGISVENSANGQPLFISKAATTPTDRVQRSWKAIIAGYQGKTRSRPRGRSSEGSPNWSEASSCEKTYRTSTPRVISPLGSFRKRNASPTSVASAASWNTLKSKISVGNDRDMQREKIMRLIDSEDMLDPTSNPYLRCSHEKRILLLAEEMQSERHFEFSRFERLCLINILNARHELVKLDEMITYPTTINLTGERETEEKLCMALLRYHWAIDIFERFSKFKQPETVDRLRRFLQNNLPTGLLDAAGREQREIDVVGVTSSYGKGTEAIINYYRMYARYISLIVDNLARLLIAVVGGILLLVPMTVLIFVDSLGLTLGITFIFLLVFSVVLSLVSKASNDRSDPGCHSSLWRDS